MQSPIISLKDVGLLRERRNILSDINLDIFENDFLAITGPNGGGKTTLLRIILKLIKPTSGSVTYLHDGKPTNSLPIGYLPQKNMIDSHFPITVSQVISSGLIADKSIGSDAMAEEVDRIIHLMDLQSRRDYTINQLSGGQLQRTLFGRALISKPKILILDEPLSYLDKHFEERTYKIISEISSHTTILLVSHEMSRIASMANRHIIIDHTLEECTAGHHYFTIDCPCPKPHLQS